MGNKRADSSYPHPSAKSLKVNNAGTCSNTINMEKLPFFASRKRVAVSTANTALVVSGAVSMPQAQLEETSSDTYVVLTPILNSPVFGIAGTASEKGLKNLKNLSPGVSPHFNEILQNEHISESLKSTLAEIRGVNLI